MYLLVGVATWANFEFLNNRNNSWLFMALMLALVTIDAGVCVRKIFLRAGGVLVCGPNKRRQKLLQSDPPQVCASPCSNLV